LFSGKTIFFAALDWGLGHATRSVQLIRELEKNNTLILGVTPLTLKIFEEEFPHLQKINVPAYNVTYSSFMPLWLKLLTDWRRISVVIKEENKLLDEMVLKNKIDVVISDNRFGWYSKKVHSVFISHQIFLKAPFATSFIQEINKKYILKFNEIWIPDYENETESLSGELSHGKHFHPDIKYIGPLSRLPRCENTGIKYDYLFLLSGPEPHRSILKNELKNLAKKATSKNFALADMEATKPLDNMETYASPDPKKISQLICSSQHVICRSGYSTLMDLHRLEKRNMSFIPTPGQTEQEYLAGYWKEKFSTAMVFQNEIHHLKF
jgi:hypothetical protein